MRGIRIGVAVALLGCWSAAARGLDSHPRIHVLAEPSSIADFSLMNQEGRSFRMVELLGRDVLVFFGFTHCPTVCPAAMTRMRILARLLEEEEGDTKGAPAIVLISVDGDRDTPPVLQSYLAGLPPNFIGLTGDPKVVRDIAAQFKAVFFKGLPYDNAGNYQVEHTSMIYLVDADGRLRATFLDAPVEAMAETMRRLTARLD